MDNLLNSQDELSSPNFYSGLLKWNGYKVFYLVFQILLTFVALILLYSVIWYERSCFESNYRTVLNPLLSHICMISIARLFIARIPHSVMILTAPCSTETCNFVILIGRYSFLCIHAEVCIWQVVKFLYIFQWKHIVILNEEFLAVFLTMWNLFVSLIFVFTTYMIGINNAEPDFHICTGRDPAENIIFTVSEINGPLDFHLPHLTEVILIDPLSILALAIFVLLFGATVSVWIYTNKQQLIKFWKKFTHTGSHIMMGCPPVEESAEINNSKNAIEIKNVIREATPSLAVIALFFVLFVPSGMARLVLMDKSEEINIGKGRMWMYISKITVPILSYCILPAVIIGNNSKMRSTLIRELKAKLFS